MSLVYALECGRCAELERVGVVGLTGLGYARAWLHPYQDSQDAVANYSHVCPDCLSELEAEAEQAEREDKEVQA